MSKQSSKTEKVAQLPEQVVQLFEQYPNVKFFWVVGEMAFMPEKRHAAENHAKSVGGEVTKIERP